MSKVWKVSKSIKKYQKYQSIKSIKYQFSINFRQIQFLLDVQLGPSKSKIAHISNHHRNKKHGEWGFKRKNTSRQFFTITRMSAIPGCPNIFWGKGNISFTELTYSGLKQAIIFRASLPCSRSILASSSSVVILVKCHRVNHSN